MPALAKEIEAMGWRTNLKIAEAQATIGLKPARGREAELLREMSDAAFTLIKVIELESSGIRDGDGRWYGSDAMAGTARDLVGIIKAYLERSRGEEPLPGDALRAGDNTDNLAALRKRRELWMR
jgi:hypothetical protein